MNRFFRSSLAIATVCLAILATGCASFPADTLKDVKVPVVSSPKKPSAYVEVKFFSGKPENPQAAELPAVRQQLQPVIENVTRKSDVFSYVSFDASEQARMDHTIKLHFYNHGEAGAAAVMGFISGLTFGVIPAAATDKYTLVTQVSGNGSTPVTLRSDDSITTWIGIWFLPVAGKTPAKATNVTIEELVNDALRQMVEQRQLKFAQTPPLRHSEG